MRPQAAQTHVTRERLHTVGDATVSRYRRPLKIEETLSCLYENLRALNNAKPYCFLNEMNKKDLPAMYSTVLWCLFVVLLFFCFVLFFLLYCVTTVTPFIERTVALGTRQGRISRILTPNVSVFLAKPREFFRARGLCGGSTTNVPGK